MNLGKRIHEMRHARGFTISQLAAVAKVTSGFISQLEHSKTMPSLQTLQRVATALQTPLAYFLLEDDCTPQVVRAHERHKAQFGDDGLRATFLSPASSLQLELILLDLPVDTSAWATAHPHVGHECHLVMCGTVRASYGAESYILEEGDTILWEGTIPHCLENIGAGDAQVLLAMTPAAWLHHDSANGGDHRPRHQALKPPPHAPAASPPAAPKRWRAPRAVGSRSLS